MSVRAAHPGAALRVYTFAEARGPRRRSGRPGSLLTLAPHRSGRAGSAASGSSTDSFATRRRVPAGPESRAMATAIPKACLASSAIRCRDVETGPNLGVLAVFPSTGATCRCPLPSTGSRGLNSPLRRCRVGGGAHRRARLRPPLKRYVRFSRIPLSQGCPGAERWKVLTSGPSALLWD